MNTKNTITPKNTRNKQKSGEITRLLELFATLQLQPDDIARETGVSARTITYAIYQDKPTGAQLMRKVHQIYGVSIDWLISGVGTMFIAESNKIAEQHAIYSVNSDRLSRMHATIDGWMQHATDDEQAWLEIELRNKLQ